MFSLDSFQTVQSESSSKGNQRKFYKDGYWVKLDSEHCCQGLAEDFVSQIERCISGFNFVPYKSLQVSYRDNMYNACLCKNMYNQDVQFISLRSLFKQNKIPLNTFIKYDDIKDNIKAVVEKVYILTDLNLLEYFRDLLFLDALILNEDRHYMNLGVCYYGEKYYIAPCFDNGSSLFCVDWTYRKRKSLEENIEFAKSVARPFSKFYDKQISAFLELGVAPLRINRVALNWLLQNYTNELYSEQQVLLVKSVLYNRLNYYNGDGKFGGLYYYV